jgi:hypothetical protein
MDSRFLPVPKKREFGIFFFFPFAKRHFLFKKSPQNCFQNFPMDHAAMLETERQGRLQHAMQHAPPFPVRGMGQLFNFPHSAGQLSIDRKRVREIMDLRAKVEGGKIGDSDAYKGLGVPISFHEAFISTHEQRFSLMCRVLQRYDVDSQNVLVAMQLQSFPWPTAHFQPQAQFDKALLAAWKSAVASSYPSAKHVMNQQMEHLLQMHVLGEALTRETRELAARCADFEELDRSMLMAATPELPSIPRTFHFQATAPAFGAPASLQ